MLKRAVVLVMLLSVCASHEEPQADTTTMVIIEDSEEKVDFRKFDYCSVKCFGTSDKHSACDCKLRPPRTYVQDDLVKFRQGIIDKHNELRNMFASGDEPKEYFNGKKVGNMMVLNYDLELEYIAKCYGGYFNSGHDTCRTTHDKLLVGQNLAGNSAKQLDYQTIGVEMWYNEVQLIDSPNYAPLFTGLSPKDEKGYDLMIGHFTQVVWASMVAVGCARVWNPENPHPSGAYKFAMICNYKPGPGGSAGNMKDANIFLEGEPCSKCPYDTKCNDKYTSLCGKLEPVPTDPLEDDQSTDKGSERLVPSQIISLCAFVALLYFY